MPCECAFPSSACARYGDAAGILANLPSGLTTAALLCPFARTQVSWSGGCAMATWFAQALPALLPSLPTMITSAIFPEHLRTDDRASRGYFSRDACERARTLLGERIVGQDEPVKELVDAVCDHLEQVEDPERPLAVALHGPPGVGKSLTHRLLAKAMYNATTDCPGRKCPAYKLTFATEAGKTEEEHATEFREHLEVHLSKYPQPMIALEEYDKAGCGARTLLRHLLDKGAIGETRVDPRSIIVLEANIGGLAISEMAKNLTSKPSLSIASSHSVLQRLMHRHWAEHGCDDGVDTHRLLSYITRFLPMFPIDFPNLQRICERFLQQRRSSMASDGFALEWDGDVPRHMANVEFEDGFSPHGGQACRTSDNDVRKAVRSATRSENCQPPCVVRLSVSENAFKAVCKPPPSAVE